MEGNLEAWIGYIRCDTSPEGQLKFIHFLVNYLVYQLVAEEQPSALIADELIFLQRCQQFLGVKFHFP